MTVILEQVELSEAGVHEIRQTATGAISARQARQRVNSWLCHHVTMMLNGGEPTLIVGETTHWRVPVIFCAPQTGPFGVVGAVEVNAESGEIDKSPENVKAMLCEAKKLAEKLPPFKIREVPPEYMAKNVPTAPSLTILDTGEVSVQEAHKVYE